MSDATRSGTRSRIGLKVVGVAFLAAGLVAVGWAAAEMVVSPNQRAASIAAPTQGPITAVVEYGTLSEMVAVTGTVTPTVSVVSTLPPSLVGVVTVSPEPGTVVTPGTPVLEVSGRPVIAYTGNYPFFRELSEGDEGDDVRQLQENLLEFGSKLSVDGKYGPRTSIALTNLYKALGYDPPRAEVTLDGAGNGTENSGENADETASKSAIGNVYFNPSEALLMEDGDLVLEEVPARGAVVSEGAALKFRADGVVVVADLDAATAAAINEGDAVRMTDSSGKIYLGSVSSVTTDTDEEQGTQNTARIVLDSNSDTPALDDQLVAVIETQQVSGESLLVPTRSVINRDNAAYVYLVGPERISVPVSVRELGTLNGVSAIEIVDGELTAGDEVEVS